MEFPSAAQHAAAEAIPKSACSAARWHATCDPTSPGAILSEDRSVSGSGEEGGEVCGGGRSAARGCGISFWVFFGARLTLTADAAGATNANGDGPVGGDYVFGNAGVMDGCPARGAV